MRKWITERHNAPVIRMVRSDEPLKSRSHRKTFYPIEAAFLPEPTSGWRAGEPGKQTISLHFIQPQRLRRIWIHFMESEVERTQEYFCVGRRIMDCLFVTSFANNGNSPQGSIVGRTTAR